jgi:Glycosyltransferase family 87
VIQIFARRLFALIDRALVFIGQPRFLNFLIFYLAAAGLAIIRGSRQDYGAYELQWRLILDGKDPWTAHTEEWYRNAYGPLFNCLALPYSLHPLLPKLLFVLVWLGTAFFLLRRVKTGSSLLSFSAAVALLLANPFFIVETTELGHFDILVASSFLFCLVFYRRESGMKGDLLAAIFFVIAVGLKFYPIVTLPFLCLGRTVRLRFTALCILEIIALFGVGWMIWGPSVLAPLLFATAREARHLSIFFSLDWLLAHLSLSPLPSWVWKVLLLVSGGGLFVLHWRKRFAPEPACLMALLVTFLFYSAGHHQFQIILFCLFGDWISNVRTISPALQRCVRTWEHYLIFICVYILLYMLTISFGGNYGWLAALMPLPAFWLGIRTLVTTIKLPSIAEATR